MFVKIKGLNFRYKNAKEETINDFHLRINKGEIVSILGQSGSGKSTVLRLVAGLEMPGSGSIIINNVVMVDDNNFVLPEKRGVGMVFQDYALFPHLTVEENVMFGLKKIDRKAKKVRVGEVLALVNLKEFSKRYPYELSGGQQQRAALARALAPQPSLLLLDEPFSNLDKDLQLKIREELKGILKATGITAIFVTHDQSDAKALADYIVILEKGKILQEGKPLEILE
ncbi:MAG: ABC transporter [Clostridiaceae bacterium BRH_c20a]|nr:MAG: ABC transporter [Clostridiaceae bacterium BRH_c20a]